MDLDRDVYHYFNWTGATPPEGHAADHFSNGGFEASAERGEVRFFREPALSVRDMYAKFAGCDSVNGNDAILGALHDALSGRATMFSATEGEYLLYGTDQGPTVDVSRHARALPVRDLERVDLDGDDLTAEVGRERLAIHRLGTPETTRYVAIVGDGRSHAWSGEWVEGGDTVGMLRALDAAGALPDAVRALMGDALKASLESDATTRERGWIPGP